MPVQTCMANVKFCSLFYDSQYPCTINLSASSIVSCMLTLEAMPRPMPAEVQKRAKNQSPVLKNCPLPDMAVEAFADFFTAETDFRFICYFDSGSIYTLNLGVFPEVIRLTHIPQKILVRFPVISVSPCKPSTQGVIKKRAPKQSRPMIKVRLP